ncbi:MAG: sugar diacid recognition domain-containing protein [Lachnospiraceae bacterium]|nr:sugar diacid recognition domain-containing protein [Lachnospiraceae bacterium]
MPFMINRKTAQQIVVTLKEVCDHDINFIDTNGIIFASTDRKRIGTFHEIGKQVISAGKTIEVESGDDFSGTNPGVNIPFLHYGELLAVIGISGDPAEVRKYAYLAQKITALLLREHELDVRSSNDRAQNNYIIHALIYNESISHDYLCTYLNRFSLTLETRCRTIVIQLDSRYTPSNLSLIEYEIQKAFHIIGSTFYTFHYPSEYVLILDCRQYDHWAYVFPQLIDKCGEILKIGIGSIQPLSHQHQSYETALIARKSLGGGRQLAVFDELDIEMLLGGTDPGISEYFLDKTIRQLDQTEQDLLNVYFSCDMSLKQTCEKLFLHKNTLQYQLDKIGRKSGYNPRSFRDAAVLYLGLKLLSSS